MARRSYLEDMTGRTGALRSAARRLQQASGSGASNIYYAEKFITVSGKEYGFQLSVDRTNGVQRTYRASRVGHAPKCFSCINRVAGFNAYARRTFLRDSDRVRHLIGGCWGL